MMAWYTASIIIAIRPRDEPNSDFLVHENLLLIDARTASEARVAARKLGEEEATLDDDLTIDGLPAVREFIGVRKIVTVSNPHPMNQDQDRPADGTEVSYSVYRVSDRSALQRLASGESVEVEYLE